MIKKDLVIIGAGPAGLTAAVYGRRAGLDVLVIEQNVSGGQMRLTFEIENWPGLILTTGEELSENLHNQAIHFGAEFLNTKVNALVLDEDLKIVKTSDGEVEAGAIIVASGAIHRSLGCPGEAEFSGRGVSFCAVCDAGFFRNEVVAVVGGGNTALEEAQYLSKFVKHAYVIHRRDQFRADAIAVDKAKSNPKLSFVLDTEVTAILGGDGVEKISLFNKKTSQASELEVTGVFLFVGTVPDADFLPSYIKRIEGGWVAVDSNLETNIAGVFAAGDVRDTDLRQIVTAAADGARAALNVAHYLENKKTPA